MPLLRVPRPYIALVSYNRSQSITQKNIAGRNSFTPSKMSWGRDTNEVFPNAARKEMLESDAVKAILGNKKFISESELEKIKEVTGGRGRVENGSIASDKPLAVILAERKEAKQVAFQEQWKQMKTGKNRPLEEDELVFLDTIAEAETQRLRQLAAEEKQELEAFHQAIQKQEEEKKHAAENMHSGDIGSMAKNSADKNSGKKGLVQKHKIEKSSKKNTSILPVKVVIKKKERNIHMTSKTHEIALNNNNNIPPNESMEEEKKETNEKKVVEDNENALGSLLGGYDSDST